MAVPRSSLRGFLTHAKGALRAAIESSQHITFVIGNESADLDSMTSSVLYAYVRSLSPSRNAFTPLYVPITNIPLSDIALRPEFLIVFKHANIESEHLITLDDLPDLSVIESKLRPENTKWILVDHNALQGQLGKIYSDRIGGAIDHHEDEGKIPKDTGSEPRIIEKCGSCTSLVTKYCRQAWDSLSESATSPDDTQGGEPSNEGANTKLWDAEVAQLGLASILIDTTNLQSEDKTTQHDRQAAEYLEAKILSSPKFSGSFDRTRFYGEIDSAKKDIGSLKLQDILRKDYKLWKQNGLKLGISSVVKNIDFLQQKARDETNTQSSVDDSFLEALRLFCKERDLDLYSLMTTSTSARGEFQRELLVWGFNERASSAAQTFATNSKDELGLVDWHGSSDSPDNNNGTGGSLDNGHWRKVFWQTQVQHSRKRVAPLLREAMT